MMGKLALTSATGKLGSAVLNAVLDHHLIDPKDLVVCTSSSPDAPKLQHLHDKSITIRHADFDAPSTLEAAYSGCTRLFLVSTPRIEMDYDDAPLWQGREKHHRAAIDAAVKVGVKYIYYTSLGFANPSKASVMRAHTRTEEYLQKLPGVTATVLREGLYNESWPLYFGYYFELREEKRTEVLVAGDGPISWTSISDMAFCTAKILSEGDAWAGKLLCLSQSTSCTLRDIAGIVSEIKGEEVKVKVVSRKEYEDHYVGKGMEKASVEWWSSTYDALKDGECKVEDDTLDRILHAAGRKAKPLEETMKEMMQ